MDEAWGRLLAEREGQGLRRSLRQVSSVQDSRVVVGGRSLRVFCSNNYLGLAGDERVRSAAKRAIDEWGWGAGASRLISGTMSPHIELEKRLAALKGTEAALVFGSGYLANLAALRAAAGPGDVIFMDKLNHASLIDAAQSSGAEVRVYPHRGYERLAHLLGRYSKARRRVIVSDTLFSMDGDFADLGVLVELKERHDALLLVDEAHATGVHGARGRGVAEQFGVESHIDLSVGTLSKALGGIGGFVAGSRLLIDYLVNTARSFVYTTAVPTAACAAASAAIDIVQQEPQRRRRLLELAARMRGNLQSELGADIGDSCSQIVPVLLGDSQTATRVAEDMREAGFLVSAIRPPTVPRGSSRLRISVMATMSNQDVDDFVGALGQALRKSSTGAPGAVLQTQPLRR